MANLRWHQDRVMTRLTGEMARRGQVAAAAVERQAKARIGISYPPASRPGQPPHRRTGALQRSIIGAMRVIGRKIRVSLTASAPYARFLQRGTRNMRRRPIWATDDRRLVVDILSGRRRS